MKMRRNLPGIGPASALSIREARDCCKTGFELAFEPSSWLNKLPWKATPADTRGQDAIHKADGPQSNRAGISGVFAGSPDFRTPRRMIVARGYLTSEGHNDNRRPRQTVGAGCISLNLMRSGKRGLKQSGSRCASLRSGPVAESGTVPCARRRPYERRL